MTGGDGMTTEQIQHLLAYLGYSPGPVDGIPGPKTTAAITAFQRDFDGLTADGNAGEDTRKALRQAVADGMPEKKADAGDSLAAGTFWDGIRYFTRGEFACKCGLYHAPYCDGYPAEMDERVVRLAEAARTHFGRPGHVISGLRCRQHNADSGGVANSQHMDGTACDLMIEGVDADRLLGWIQDQAGVRYAYKINGSNVHFDVPRGGK